MKPENTATFLEITNFRTQVYRLAKEIYPKMNFNSGAGQTNPKTQDTTIIAKDPRDALRMYFNVEGRSVELWAEGPAVCEKDYWKPVLQCKLQITDTKGLLGWLSLARDSLNGETPEYA